MNIIWVALLAMSLIIICSYLYEEGGSIKEFLDKIAFGLGLWIGYELIMYLVEG